MLKVSIIGTGRLGGALAIALARQGFEVENLIARNKEKAIHVAELIEPRPTILLSDNLREIRSEIILIATQDFEIERAARQLAENLPPRKPFVFHTSGSLSSEVLDALKKIGCPAGSIHPLVSVSDPVAGAGNFAGAYFCVEGEASAVRLAEEIVARLGGKSFSIETKYKMLYHASAVMASGHLVALVDAAIETLARCGLDPATGQATLLPLIKSTLENLEKQTPAEALTGTFARADVGTFQKHLASLEAHVSEEIRQIYLQLGERSAHLAERQGASHEALKEIEREISLAKKKFKC